VIEIAFIDSIDYDLILGVKLRTEPSVAVGFAFLVGIL
jgi:hypothetical protein